MNILALIFFIHPILSKKPEDDLIILQESPTLELEKLQIQEIIFKQYAFFPFIILLFGCFMTLYDAYYNFFLIMKITLFLYYLLSIFLKYDELIINRNLLLILLFSFISGVLVYIAYKSYKQFINKHYNFKKAFFGGITGCFLLEIIFHYISSFNSEYEQNIYFILFPIFIISFGLLNILLPLKIAFIPCSVVSGLFFIKLGMDNIINYELTKAEKILDIIVLIIIAVLAFFYQIYHLKRKKNESPVFSQESPSRKNLDISADSGPQNLNNTNVMEMTQKDSGDNNKTVDEGDVTQDNCINDQDD